MIANEVFKKRWKLDDKLLQKLNYVNDIKRKLKCVDVIKKSNIVPFQIKKCGIFRETNEVSNDQEVHILSLAK